MNTIERLFNRVMYGKPDYSIKPGDVVTTKAWKKPVTVVDINWAIRAAAVELAPGGGIVVWPVGNLRKVRGVR